MIQVKLVHLADERDIRETRSEGERRKPIKGA
jgi:hypothetical protein